MSDQNRTKSELIEELKMLRNRIAEASREDKSRFDALFKHTPIPLFICKTDGRLVDCNAALAELLDYPRTDLIGIPFFGKEIFSEDDLPRALRDLEMVEKGTSTRPDEFTMHGRNRLQVYVKTTLHPVKIKDETFVLGIAKDITRRKMAEEERKQFETQLRQAQKMEAIGTLAGGIAHDFNNILSPIIVHAELTLFDLPEDSPLRTNMEEVLAASDRARDLINQILALSRQGEEEPYPLKVTPIVKEVLKLLRMSLPTTIKIHQNIASKTDSILADPSQIHQVLMNLCTNAGYAMREKGGELEVSLQNVMLDSDTLPAFPDIVPGPFVKLSVRDTGHGMEPAVMDRIFDPYFTTKKKGQGTGLGLAVVQGIINSYGGAITVDSEPERETTFAVFLPEVEVESGEVEKPVSPFPRGEESILLVDDDVSLLTSLQGALGKLGYSVTAHSSSIEALEIFKSDPMQFDLVITDQTMPDLTGEGLSKEFLSIRPDIPIILCTGYSEIFDEEKARTLGIREYMMKPIVLHKMATALREILDSV